MRPVQETDAIREAVGYFETADALQEAIDELMSSGFDRAELSLLAAEHAARKSSVTSTTKSRHSRTTPRPRGVAMSLRSPSGMQKEG